MAKPSATSSREKKGSSIPGPSTRTKTAPEGPGNPPKSPSHNRLQYGLFLLSLLTPALFSSNVFFGYTSVRVLYFEGIVTIMALLAVWQESVWRQKPSLLQWSILAFLGITAIANLLGVDAQNSFWSSFARMEGFVTYIYLGLYFLLITRFQFSARQWTVALAVSVSIALLLTIFVLSTKAGRHTSDERLMGTFGNPTFMAIYLLQQLGILSLVALRIEWKSRRVRNVTKLSGLGVAAIVLLGGMVMTGSRSSFIGLAAGIVILSVLLAIRNARTQPKRVLLYAAIAVGLAGIVWFISQTDTVQHQPIIYRLTHLSGSTDTWQPRKISNQIALNAFVERPLLGWGQDNYNYGFASYYVSSLAPEGSDWYDRVHNVPLEWAFSGGVLGFLAYLAIWAGGLFQLIRSSLPAMQRYVLIAVLTAYFIFNLFNPDSILALQGFFLLLAFIDTSFTKDGLQSVTPQLATNRPAWLLPVRGVAIAGLVILAYFAIITPAKTLRQLNQFNRQSSLFERVTLLEQTYRAATVGKIDVADQLVTLALSSLNDANVSAVDKQGCYDRAVNIWGEVCQQHPQSSRYKARLASLYIAHDDYARAFPLYEEAVAIEKGKRPALFVQIGSAHLQQGNVAAAMTDFKQAYQLEPRWETPLVYEAMAYVVDHKPAQADSLLYKVSDAGLVANIALVKQAYYMMRNPAGLMNRLRRVKFRHQFLPEIYVDWTTAAFDAHDADGLLTALNAFSWHHGIVYDYSILKQIYTDAMERNVSPTERMRELVAGLAKNRF
ncbi:O-antigen ligase family protein [Spirosoma sp. BT702]|uniref:O-antigen ligase family protein n=1 Tax=Spirosoma profusum TaxID=2771354 RepID=A0A927AQM2_9BACT|nr:O-antigen ligase family protein [Spirosoma profusum]MBD2700828.1 O-antigen ligase family protein [Spirosoma profusum]